MKKLFTLLFLVFGLSAQAATLFDATLTVTNAPVTNGMSVTVSGSTRTFTNNVTAASSQIVTNNSIGGIATNIFNHFAAYGISGITVTFPATNQVRFSATNSFSVSLVGNYGSVTNTTNSGASMTGVRVPMSAEASAVRTNVATQIVSGIGSYSQVALDQNSAAASELLGKTNTQTATGVKTFSGANTYSNSNQRFVGGVVTNVSLYATNGTLSGVQITGSTNTLSTLTNVSIINSSISGTVTATNSFQLNVYDEPNDATNIFDFTVSDESGSSNTPIRLLNLNTNQFGTEPTFITTSRAVWIRDGASVTNLTGSSSNFVHKGTNQYTGDIAFSRYDITSLANGNNAAVNPGTNVYLKVSGPTTNFTINGISGGRDGRRLYIQNSTGYQMTIANDSGVDPTAANRILTGVGGDLVMSNNPTFLAFTYDSAANRWIVQTFSGSVTAGGVVGSGSQSPLTNNVDGNSYSITNLSNLTVTNKFTNSTLTASALVASDGNKALKSVTIGSGLSYDGTTLSAGEASTNMFTLTSTLQVPILDELQWATFLNVTNQRVIAGFLRIRGTNDVNDACDIIVHVDATPDGSPAISICQFQGAVQGVAPKLYAQSSSTSDQFSLSIVSMADNWVFTIDAFGDALPPLNNFTNGVGFTSGSTPDPIPDQTDYAVFALVNGQIAANSLQAKKFTLVDDAGYQSDFAIAGADIAGDGYLLGDQNAVIDSKSIHSYGNIVGDGDLTITGKITGTGGIDPPYVLYDAHSRAETKARVLIEVPVEKQTGASQFWNPVTKRMEIYVASEDMFYDLLGNVLPSPSAADVAQATKQITKANADRKAASDARRAAETAKRAALKNAHGNRVRKNVAP